MAVKIYSQAIIGYVSYLRFVNATKSLIKSQSMAFKMKHHGANPRRAAPLDVATCYVRMRCEYHPFNPSCGF